MSAVVVKLRKFCSILRNQVNINNIQQQVNGCGKIKITISKDELSAFLTIPVKGATFPDKQALISAIQKAGIQYGLLSEKLTQIVEKKNRCLKN